MPEDLIEIVITAPDEDWLVAFTRRLVEQRLAACGHHTSIRSVYTWEGQIHNQQETRVALHTRAAHFETIVAITDAEHPYDVPCVISLPVTNASPAYRAWILNSTNHQLDELASDPDGGSGPAGPRQQSSVPRL